MTIKYFLLLLTILAVNLSFSLTRREIVDACLKDICIEKSKENLLKNEIRFLPKEIVTNKRLQNFLTETYLDNKNSSRKLCKNLHYKSNSYKNEELPFNWNDANVKFVIGVEYDTTKFQEIIKKNSKSISQSEHFSSSTIVAVENTPSNIDKKKDEPNSLQTQIDELQKNFDEAENTIKILQKENKQLKEELSRNSNQNPKPHFFLLTLLLTAILISVLIFLKKDSVMTAPKKIKTKLQRKKNSDKINLSIPDEEIKTPPPSPLLKEKQIEPQIFSFPAIKEKNWLIVKGKAIGKSHISKNQPCQDNHYSEQINKTWGIAVNCDGMGSGDISEIGSEKVSKNLVKFLREKIEKEDWFLSNSLPSNDEWNTTATEILKGMKGALAKYANANKLEFPQLATTIIAIVYSPHGLLVAHIGDGRAGYCNDKGEWKSAMIPHKGEEANETTFITSDWDNENLISSGVPVPECRVINEPIRAFTLMSDGCEQHFFETKIQDPNSQVKKLIEINSPYANTMNSLVGTFYEMINDKIEADVINNHFNKYVEGGTTRIKNEPDDKSIIIGIFH